MMMAQRTKPAPKTQPAVRLGIILKFVPCSSGAVAAEISLGSVDPPTRLPRTIVARQSLPVYLWSKQPIVPVRQMVTNPWHCAMTV